MYNKYKFSAHPGVGTRAGTPVQRGVAAIEFALIFPVFFLLLYGIIAYVLIFLAQQSLTLAAEEGARAALRYTTGDRGAAACGTVTPLVSWLVYATCPTPVTDKCPAISTAQCITVTVTYPYTTHPLVPSLPGMSAALPTTLASSAMVQID